MFVHYLAVNGTTLINSEATEAYARAMAPRVSLQHTYGNDRIHVALGEDEYRSPLIDDAPWANPNDETTDDFFGLYPLNIEGIGDSTLAASVTQNMDAGGSINQGRDASRSIKVSGVLVGANERAAQVGLTWLRAAVRDDGCGSGDCGSGEMSFFLSEPNVPDQSWTDETGNTARAFGPQGVGTVAYRWLSSETPIGMPARAVWEFTADEGTAIRFGSRQRLGSADLSSSPVVRPYRVNYLPNPTVRRDLSLYQITGGTGAWYPSGGADAGSYGRVTLTGNQVVVPRAYGSGRYGTGPYGKGGLTTQPIRVTATAAVALAPNVATGSIALRGTAGQRASVLLVDPNGTTLASTSVKLTADWVRYSVTGQTAGGFVSVAVGSSTSFDFDQALLEIADSSLPYFDGVSSEGDMYTASWAGVPDASQSVQRWNDVAQVCGDDSDFRPFIEVVQGSLSALRLRWYLRDLVPMSEVLEPYYRTYYQVACTQAPQIIQEFGDDNVGYFIQVEMLFEAGNPFAYSSPHTVPTSLALTATHTDVALPVEDDAWLVDPDCVPITPAPVAPVIFDSCLDAISVWQRYFVSIPAEDVADWASSVPTLRFDSKSQSFKQVRVRFHPNPFGRDPQQIDPAAYCSEFVISYLPALSTLEVNGTTKRATASKSGKATVSANHLLYGTDGTPITWPELTCGIPYIMTVDIPPSATIDLFDLELELQRRE